MPEVEKNVKKSKTKKRIILIVSIIVALIIIFRLTLFFYSDVVISSSSMEPTLKNGFAYRLNKTTYWFNHPQRGDIIVAHHDDKSIGSVAKRIIGLPGEKVQIKDGKVYINDKPLEEKYIFEYIEDSGDVEMPIILGKEEYFVLGDNTDESFDSRYEEYGMINRKSIIGKITGPSWRNYFRYANKSRDK